MQPEAPNPYEPPRVHRDVATRTSRFMVASVVLPTLLSVGGAFCLWVALVAALDRRINHRWDMLLWSATLIGSVAASTYLINRIWPRQPSGLAHGVGYLLFGATYWMLEGGTSNGPDLFQTSLVSGTLAALPMIAFLLTRLQKRARMASQANTGQRITTPFNGARPARLC